jgi:hypothetical protein
VKGKKDGVVAGSAATEEETAREGKTKTKRHTLMEDVSGVCMGEVTDGLCVCVGPCV